MMLCHEGSVMELEGYIECHCEWFTPTHLIETICT